MAGPGGGRGRAHGRSGVKKDGEVEPWDEQDEDPQDEADDGLEDGEDAYDDGDLEDDEDGEETDPEESDADEGEDEDGEESDGLEGLGGGDVLFTPPGHRSGFVAIVGKPNVGKSTLMNHLVSYKVSIVSPRPQTTRNRIAGIRSDESTQIVFVDTPGVHVAGKALNQFMMEQVRSTLEDVDLILYIQDASTRGEGEEDSLALELLKSTQVPRIAALNKVDRVSKPSLLPRIAALSERGIFEEIVPISALDGTGVDDLLQTLISRLPEGPRYFPEDQVTDVSERFIVSEIVREKVFHLLKEEVPYSTAVEIEAFEDLSQERNLLRIHAVIHVERDSQKAIVIGKQGSMIKQIGALAREEIERLFGTRVFLQLFVRVDPNWTRDARSVRRLGHGSSTPGSKNES